ncbi:MAG: transcription-repair coupling factor [Omnitrophica WOR_2 bacterium RIFCSPHIGHO2_02_FULL_45_21]|nr:MAG: transcription-repair coupling factor [Omnitrophica WOR_2 bacterium RIFCSPHIGHO2_02_FULL_45_21]
MFKSIKLYPGQEIDLEQLISTLLSFGYQRHDYCADEGDFSRRGEIIDVYPATFECPLRISLDFDKIESISSYDLLHNKVIYSHELVIILPRQHGYRRAALQQAPLFESADNRRVDFTEELPLNLFLELKKGDLVVHNQHGLGIYAGMHKLPAAGGTSDHLSIEYADKEKLFVPLESAHLIQKYIGISGRRPKVNRLGSKEWLTVKKRVKKGIKTVALELLKAQAERSLAGGFAFSRDTDWQAEFEKTFPYQETPGQAKALAEVKKDMQSQHPMDRLLCGDVGYGKTEVALRAAFKAVMDNKQAAFLVPTTILAEQHYQNFIQRLKDFPVNIQMLSRFKSDAEQEKIISGLREGKVDIVIGTHRLLSADIVFNDLGLLIIDEEQRFGVRAKERIKSLKSNVDILTLTATPIPRTLYLGLMGIKDLSMINTPPQNRMPIATYVVEYDNALIVQAIRREIARRGQVFFVHNQVYDIEKICQRLKNLLSADVRIAYAHGQMPEKELEKIMLGFLQRKVDCLVCTTIIESGIDMPYANTLLVNNAQAFGLPDLHQLRGRVGRFNRKAYSYFLIPKDEILTADARRRLEAMKDYSQLGAGFELAMEDLEIRGVGNVLGYEQHGFIYSVGFDLYCRLLKEMVSSLKSPGEQLQVK